MVQYFDPDPNAPLDLKKRYVEICGKTFPMLFGSGLFSVKKIDKGAELLINNAVIKEGDYILDLGCGNGIVGISLLHKYNCKLMFADVNYRAVYTTRKNLELNHLNARVKKSYCYTKIDEVFDVILTNIVSSISKKICFDIISGAESHLVHDGALQIACMHQKEGKYIYNIMNETFGNVEIIAKKYGYRIYLSRKW